MASLELSNTDKVFFGPKIEDLIKFLDRYYVDTFYAECKFELLISWLGQLSIAGDTILKEASFKQNISREGFLKGGLKTIKDLKTYPGLISLKIETNFYQDLFLLDFSDWTFLLENKAFIGLTFHEYPEKFFPSIQENFESFLVPADQIS